MHSTAICYTKQNQTGSTHHLRVPLPGCPPSCGMVLFPHFLHWCVPYCQYSNASPNPESTHTHHHMTRDHTKIFWRDSVCMCAYLPPLQVLWRQRVVERDVIGYFLHEPLEAFTSMFFPDSQQTANTSFPIIFSFSRENTDKKKRMTNEASLAHL